MLENVDVGSRTLRSYRGVVPDHVLEDLVQEAERLRGARVLHVNATPYGGGVAELLRSVVTLLNDLGLVADWRIIRGDESFFEVTNRGVEYGFCSSRCRVAFLDHPERYARRTPDEPV